MTSLFNNQLIGVSMLSTYFETNGNDSVDLIVPFVKFSVHQKYNISEKIDELFIKNYICDEFCFELLPSAIVHKALVRLCKRNRGIKCVDREYYYGGDFSLEYQQLSEKRRNIVNSINSIASALMEYISSQSLVKVDLDKAKNALMIFLDKYGLSTFTGDIDKYIANIPKSEHLNRIVGRFIIQESQINSQIFNDILLLVKGNFVAKAIYFDNEAATDYNEKFNNAVLFLDAPVMLKFLGLKDNGSNIAAKELIRLLPKQIKLRYFAENLDELESIIRSYIHGLHYGRNSALTLEYFDENGYTEEDVNAYYVTLQQKLRSKNIFEFENEIELIPEYCIDYVGLEEYLYSNMIYSKNLALQNDVNSIMKINMLRKGKKPRSIADSKYIFVTSNNNLCYYSKQFLNEQRIGSVITDTDLTILLWILNGKISDNTPKDLLLANAYSAVDEVSDAFINQAVQKFSKLSNDNDFNAVFFSLLYEDIFLRRDLCNLCQNDPDTLTEESIVTIKEKYKKKLIGSISDENTLLKQEVARLRQKTKEIEDSFKAKTKQAKEEASKCATAKYDKVFKQCKITVYVCLLISFAIGLTGTIYNAILQPSNVWGYIILGIAVIVGISTLMKNSLEKTNLLFRMARKISYNAKNKEYDAAYARLMH